MWSVCLPSNPNPTPQVSVNDGADWSADGGGGTYRYLANPRLVSLRQTHGPHTGGTYLTVYGVNLVDTGSLACHFGHHHQYDANLR